MPPIHQDDGYHQYDEELPHDLVYYPSHDAQLASLTVPRPKTSFFAQAKTFIYRKYYPGPYQYALKQLFPISNLLLNFRKKYSWEACIADVLAGATVCTLLIPQSLSYATLAGLPPPFGLYTAFFASFIYAAFGTCRETSLGPFALVSLMVSQIVNEMYPELLQYEIDNPVEGLHLRLVYTMTLTFITGVQLLILALLKMGWVIDLFSSPSLQAFLQGAAFSVGATQIGSLMGIQTTQGSFLITLISLLKNILTLNPFTTMIGIISIILVSLSDVFSARKKLKIPIPSQILIVIIGTFLSWIFAFNTNFNVKVIGAIESGFPLPTPPSITLIFTDVRYWVNAIPVAASSFVVLTSISAQMAEKFRSEYSVNYNSETLAVALASLFGSFCNAYPSSAAYSRTVVCMACKPRTNLWNVTTGVILGLVIFVAGPFVHHLPKTILAAIVLASFRQSYMNWRQGVNIWKQNSGEGCVYYFTFFATILISIQAGVFAAFIGSIMHIIIQQSTFRPIYMEQVPLTQRFIPTDRLPTKKHDFYKFLEKIENAGGIYKVQAGLRYNGNDDNISTDLNQYDEYTDQEQQLDEDDENGKLHNPSSSSGSLRNRMQPSSSFSSEDLEENLDQILPMKNKNKNKKCELNNISSKNQNRIGSNASTSSEIGFNSKLDSRSVSMHQAHNHRVTTTGSMVDLYGDIDENGNPKGKNGGVIIAGGEFNGSTSFSPSGDESTSQPYSAHHHNALATVMELDQDDTPAVVTQNENNNQQFDPNILRLFIGDSISFLNCSEIGNFIIRYIKMYNYYIELYQPEQSLISLPPLSSLLPHKQNGSGLELYSLTAREVAEIFMTKMIKSMKQNQEKLKQFSTFFHREPQNDPQTALINTSFPNSPLTTTNNITTDLPSQNQQHLISVLIKDTIETIGLDNIKKFKKCVIFHHVSYIDSTGLKTILMLQNSFPDMMILFTQPGERLVQQLTVDVVKNKMDGLRFFSKLIFEGIFVANFYSHIILSLAETLRQYDMKDSE